MGRTDGRGGMGLRLTRRRFIAAAAAAAAADAFLIERSVVRVTRHDISVAGLPPGLDGLTIAQVSDTHLPGNRVASSRAVDIIARERPDVVAFTGDIVEYGESLSQLTDMVRTARGTLATIGIYGNWERRTGIRESALATAYERAGAELLVSRTTVVERNGDRLAFVGLDDALYSAPDLSRALAGPQESATIWLVHCPAFADRIPEGTPRPSAILAGHTHGGQIRLPGWTPHTPIGSGDYVAGWYRAGGTPLYVSRGVGTVVVPARFFAPAELPIFTLRATTVVPSPDSPRIVPRREG